MLVVAKTTVNVGNSDEIRPHSGPVAYSHKLNNYVNSMVSYLGRENSADLRNVIIGDSASASPYSITNIPITTIEYPQLYTNIELEDKQDSEPIQIVIEGTSSVTNEPGVMEERNTDNSNNVNKNL